MLRSSGKKIIMTEKNYGLHLPIKITGATIQKNDTLEFYIKQTGAKESVIQNKYDNINENTIDFVLTKEQSEKLKVGIYQYSIDWYRDNIFLNTIVNGYPFEVEKKVI